MFTVIRQHVAGYISFLMYGNEAQCFFSYCKHDRIIKISIRGDKNDYRLNYDTKNHNVYLSFDDMTDMIVALMGGYSYLNDDETSVLFDIMCDVESHTNRRVIKSLVKPYFKVSNFNPKNRRVISSK